MDPSSADGDDHGPGRVEDVVEGWILHRFSAAGPYPRRESQREYPPEGIGRYPEQTRIGLAEGAGGEGECNQEKNHQQHPLLQNGGEGWGPGYSGGPDIRVVVDRFFPHLYPRGNSRGTAGA